MKYTVITSVACRPYRPAWAPFGDDAEHGGAGDQLAGENGQSAQPDERRDHAADGSTIAKLQVVAGGVEIVLGGDLPDFRADPERQHE